MEIHYKKFLTYQNFLAAEFGLIVYILLSESEYPFFFFSTLPFSLHETSYISMLQIYNFPSYKQIVK